MEKGDKRFLRAVTGYRMMYDKCNANIRRELRITEINAVKKR
jgi:hypothetical protein